MAYSRYRPDLHLPDWTDGSGGGTPILAEAIRTWEAGILDASIVAEAAIPGTIGTTPGDLIYFLSSGVAARLAAGATGTVLTGGPTPAFAKVTNAEIDAAAQLDANARLRFRKAGVTIGSRRSMNIIEGTGVTITVADDSANEEVDVTINSAAGGTGYRKVTEKDVSNTLTETDLLNGEITLGAGVMGNSGTMLALLSGVVSGTTTTAIIRVKFGGVNVLQLTISQDSTGVAQPFVMVFELTNEGATNLNHLYGRYYRGSADAPTVGTRGQWTDAAIGISRVAYNEACGIDTSASQLFEVTAQNAAAAVTNRVKLEDALVAIL